MKQRTAELLSEVEGEVYREYSGRFMYGKTTTAVTFPDLNKAIGSVARAVANACEFEDTETIEDMLKDFDRVKLDDMGKGIIIY